MIAAPSAFLPSPLNPVNPVNPVKTSPYPHHLLRNVVPDTTAVRQNTVRKSAFLPERGRPARLPQGRCRMRCPIFGRDALLRVRRRCGILPRRFGAAWLLPLLGDWSFGVREVLATKDAEERKESARYAPNVVQWIDNNAEPPTQSIVHSVSCPRRMECGLVLWNARHFEIAFQRHGYGWLARG